jgi:membrane associated rhomboid family serine protease
VLTWSLIALNVLVFAYQWSLPTGAAEALVERFGVIPEVLLYGRHPGSLVTPLTSMFLHGGLGHVLGNLWFLYVFGDNVEETLGRARFGLFYVACGLAAAATQIAIAPASTVPMIGASGAIAGVLGAYLVFFPRARILTFVPVFFVLEVPAFVYIFVWFGLEVVRASFSLGAASAEGGVAFFAHVGGFVAGLALAVALRPRGERPRSGPRNVRVERAPADEG